MQGEIPGSNPEKTNGGTAETILKGISGKWLKESEEIAEEIPERILGEIHKVITREISETTLEETLKESWIGIPKEIMGQFPWEKERYEINPVNFLENYRKELLHILTMK